MTVARNAVSPIERLPSSPGAFQPTAGTKVVLPPKDPMSWPSAFVQWAARAGEAMPTKARLPALLSFPGVALKPLLPTYALPASAHSVEAIQAMTPSSRLPRPGVNFTQPAGLRQIDNHATVARGLGSLFDAASQRLDANHAPLARDSQPGWSL